MLKRNGFRTAGFTILEIMIAVAILTVGLMGILALFPVAIETSKVTIQETNAVLIAQSVEQAIREGIKHRKGQDKSGKWTYFVFQHDGVQDPVPADINRANPSHDYFVLFPDSDLENPRAMDRGRAYDEGRVFVYPETDGRTWEVTFDGQVYEFDDDTSSASPNGGGDPTKADDDKDDKEATEVDLDGVDISVEEENLIESRTYAVLDTYRLRQKKDPNASTGPIKEKADPIADFSYAFAIRRSVDDANFQRTSGRDRSGRFAPMGELYEVRIMIFRSFRKGTRHAKPIYETVILVHK